ncbi:SAM-dependent methyltransferase [Lyngbya aestuarii]|uniref:SAM-dependent methyltransferase n=1 Tax=Lyngbya aestuarii TaxID=118322 RepID=UPI00403D901F
MSNLSAFPHSSPPDDRTLRQQIASIIAAAPQQRITFAQYMDLALYHPQHGYYATRATNMGSSGDFFTSSHLGSDFGELLAEQFAQMWDILERPQPFTLVEMGAGQGLLAADILVYLHQKHPDCFAVLEYIIVEKAAALIKQQQQFLQKLRLQQLPVHWSSLAEIPENSITGCCFSNELVDALPVHQFVLEEGQLREIYVTRVDGTGDQVQFVEVSDTPSTPQLREYLDLVAIDLFSGAYPEGYRSEVNLAALDWLKTVASRLQRGFLLTIDYGYSADRYYLSARHQGTLQCYYRHRHHDQPYLFVGHQDITTHANFTALERQGELSGLRKAGFTQQGLFLMSLGLGDRLSTLATSGESGGQAIAKAQDLMRVMQRRDALHQLIDPMGLGNFGVLIQSKGLTAQQEQLPLKGLTVPPRM